jgi:hypothetical protein
MHRLEPAQDTQVFRVTLGSGVWHVRRNDVFFGDYLTRGNAIRAACAAARIEEHRGYVAQVFEPPGTMALPHHEPHLGA